MSFKAFINPQSVATNVSLLTCFARVNKFTPVCSQETFWQTFGRLRIEIFLRVFQQELTNLSFFIYLQLTFNYCECALYQLGRVFKGFDSFDHCFPSGVRVAGRDA
jgi:hypothetical protein